MLELGFDTKELSLQRSLLPLCPTALHCVRDRLATKDGEHSQRNTCQHRGGGEGGVTCLMSGGREGKSGKASEEK